MSSVKCKFVHLQHFIKYFEYHKMCLKYFKCFKMCLKCFKCYKMCLKCVWKEKNLISTEMGFEARRDIWSLLPRNSICKIHKSPPHISTLSSQIIQTHCMSLSDSKKLNLRYCPPTILNWSKVTQIRMKVEKYQFANKSAKVSSRV